MEAFTRDRDAVFPQWTEHFAFLFLLTVTYLDAVETDWLNPCGLCYSYQVCQENGISAPTFPSYKAGKEFLL